MNILNTLYTKICWNISLTYRCKLTENKWCKVAFRLNAFVSNRNITIKTMMLYLFLIRKKYSFSFVFVRSSILHVAFLPVIANLVDTNIWYICKKKYAFLENVDTNDDCYHTANKILRCIFKQKKNLSDINASCIWPLLEWRIKVRPCVACTYLSLTEIMDIFYELNKIRGICLTSLPIVQKEVYRG